MPPRRDPSEGPLHAVADRAAPKHARLLRGALTGLQGLHGEAEWEQAVAMGTWPSLIAGLDRISFRKAISPAELEPLDDLTVRILVDAAQAAVTMQRGLQPEQVTQLLPRLDVVNPFAVAWARQHVAQLVQGVVDESKDAIRSIISRAMAEGGAPRDTAKLIMHTIGLNRRQVQAIGNYRAGLVADGVKPDRVERLVARKAERALKERALMIARTETMTAANMGQQVLWEEMRRQRLIHPGARKVWIATKDSKVCPICAALDGQTTEVFGGRFHSTERGVLPSERVPWNGPIVQQPPAHPRCRCTSGIVDDIGTAGLQPQPVPPPRREPASPQEQAVARYGGSLHAIQDQLRIEAPLDHPAVREHLAALAKVPEHLHQVLVDKDIKVVIGAKAVPDLDQMQHLRGVRPRGWNDVSWDVVPGAYDPASKQLLLGSGPHGSEGLALHEYGHALDYSMGLISHQPEWVGVWHNGYHGLWDDYYKQNNTWAGAEELFAESFARVLATPDKLQQLWSRLYTGSARADDAVREFMGRLLAGPLPTP